MRSTLLSYRTLCAVRVRDLPTCQQRWSGPTSCLSRQTMTTLAEFDIQLLKSKIVMET